MKALILILALAVTSAAYADSCQEVDVRDRMSPEMQEVFKTPYSQGKIGWCYAYATADILSARLNRRLSPFHIGLSYSTSLTGVSAMGRNMLGLKTKGFYDAGFTPDAFKHMKRRGYGCPEAVVTSDMDRWGAVALYLQNLQDVYNHQASNEWGLDFAERNLLDFFASRFPTLDPQQAVNYVKSRQAKSAPLAMMSLAEAACQGQQIEIPQKLKLMSVVKSSSKKILPAINAALNRYKPISLRYSVKKHAIGESFWVDNFAQHISTIIGRKKVGNQCMYVIRNSWGATCDGYKQGVFCNQQEGTFQISARDLEKAAYSIEYIAN